MTTRRFAARGKERDGSAEFGSILCRRLQSDGAPLLGPEHRQVGQALDAEPRSNGTTTPWPRSLLKVRAEAGVVAPARLILRP